MEDHIEELKEYVKFTIGPSHERVLLLIHRRKTIEEMAEDLGNSTSTIFEYIQLLADTGHIVKRRYKHHGRKITEKGKGLLRKVYGPDIL